jgi:hypothetical protein
MACGQEMTYGRSILQDLRLAEEAGILFPEAQRQRRWRKRLTSWSR